LPVNAPDIGGNRYYYKVLTKGTRAGLNSALSSASALLRANTAPAAPTFAAPINDATIFNSRPRLLITVGTDPEGQQQTIAITGYTPSSEGAQAAGKKLVFRRASAVANGAQNILAAATDALNAIGPFALRNFNYAPASWTDGMLVSGTNRIKAVHMTELRDAVNQVRAYYGMSAFAWAEAIAAGETSMAGWSAHVAEIRQAIEQVATFVNGWDTSNTIHNISLPAWIVITGKQPSAEVMNQLRAAIALL
jgi:hypothetical protein